MIKCSLYEDEDMLPIPRRRMWHLYPGGGKVSMYSITGRKFRVYIQDEDMAPIPRVTVSCLYQD
jgi:hypothetical protein